MRSVLAGTTTRLHRHLGDTTQPLKGRTFTFESLKTTISASYLSPENIRTPEHFKLIYYPQTYMSLLKYILLHLW